MRRASAYYLALMDGWVEVVVGGRWTVVGREDPPASLDKIKDAALQNKQNQVLGNDTSR